MCGLQSDNRSAHPGRPTDSETNVSPTFQGGPWRHALRQSTVDLQQVSTISISQWLPCPLAIWAFVLDGNLVQSYEISVNNLTRFHLYICVTSYSRGDTGYIGYALLLPTAHDSPVIMSATLCSVENTARRFGQVHIS